MSSGTARALGLSPGGCPRIARLSPGRAPGAERSLSALHGNQRGNTGYEGQGAVFQASLKQAFSKQGPGLTNTLEWKLSQDTVKAVPER